MFNSSRKNSNFDINYPIFKQLIPYEPKFRKSYGAPIKFHNNYGNNMLVNINLPTNNASP